METKPASAQPLLSKGVRAATKGSTAVDESPSVAEFDLWEDNTPPNPDCCKQRCGVPWRCGVALIAALSIAAVGCFYLSPHVPSTGTKGLLGCGTKEEVCERLGPRHRTAPPSPHQHPTPLPSASSPCASLTQPTLATVPGVVRPTPYTLHPPTPTPYASALTQCLTIIDDYYLNARRQNYTGNGAGMVQTYGPGSIDGGPCGDEHCKLVEPCPNFARAPGWFQSATALAVPPWPCPTAHPGALG